MVQAQGGRGDLPTANLPTRAETDDAPASDGMVAAGTAAATNLRRSNVRCVAFLKDTDPNSLNESNPNNTQ